MVENIKDTSSNRMGQEDQVSGAAQKVKEAAMEYGRQGLDYAAGKSRQAKEYAEGYIRGNPWYTIGIALGVGVLLGILIRLGSRGGGED